MSLSKIKNRPFWLVAISVLFYVIFLLMIDINKITTEIYQIKWEYYLIIFPLIILTVVITGLRYHLILKEIGIKINFTTSLQIFVAGLSMLATPGGSGALIKSYILKKKIGASLSSTTPIVIFEKWIEFVSIIIIIGFLLLEADYLESKLIFVLGIILSVFSFIILRNSHGLNIFNNFLKKIRFTKQFVIDTEQFKQTTTKIFKPFKILQFLGITLITKIIPLVVIYFIFQSVESSLDIFSSGQIYFTSTLIGVLTFIPGGVVVTEGSLLGMLLNNNVTLGKAYILILIIRFLSLWFPIILGFIALKVIYKKD